MEKNDPANIFSKKSCLINGDKTNPYNYITIVHVIILIIHYVNITGKEVVQQPSSKTHWMDTLY